MLGELGKVADHSGARWLTLRPFGPTAGRAEAARRAISVGSCTVTADAAADGRTRLAAAAESLRVAGEPIDEPKLAARLNVPADVDPDLVVVLGAQHRLPPSLVWELAYSELVFLDTPWQQLGGRHLEEAFAAYAQRHRRFGGID
jgi:undecaprenyl diphosphate synthase